MEGLYIDLPPFSSDYSGISSVLFEMGGMIVIHGADGCIGNYMGYDEPRWYGSSSRVYSTGLKELDAVLGEEDKYIQGIKKAAEKEDIKFICILGTPPPILLGADFKAFASILEKETCLDVYAFDTYGIEYYDVGAEKIFIELAKKLVKMENTKIKNGLNIIGTTPIDIGNKRNLKRIEDILKKNGFKIISNWSMGTSYEQLRMAGKAEVNLVVSVSGIGCAQYMKRRYNIPYYTGLPIGDKAVNCLINKLKGLPKKRIQQKMGDERKVLIIGEQIKSNSIRNALRYDKGFNYVTVASFLMMKDFLMEEGDIRLKSEDDLIKLSQDKEYKIVIGDPLYKNLIKGTERCIFVELPHIALSSRLYWDENIDYLSIEGLRYIESNI